MAFEPTNAIGVTENAVFIPELWSDEVIAAYKKNLVMGNLVTVFNHTGKKGDTFHIPKPIRGSASAKSTASAVTLINDTPTQSNVSIDKHFEYSRLLEDIAEIQGLDSYRRFITDDAGYALARQVDWSIHMLGRADRSGAEPGVGTDISAADYDNAVAEADGTTVTAAVIGSDGSTAWNPAANTNAGNAAALAKAGVRTVIQSLDDSDVPMTNRYLVVPPVEKNNLLGVDSDFFVREDSVGEAGPANSIRTGYVGDVYGVPVYVSTNCPAADDDGGTADQRACLMFHKDSLALVEQLGVRSQAQYKQEFLSTLYTSDTIYGTKVLRGEGLVTIIVPA